MSEDPRLKSGLWVKAAIRSCGIHAISAMVARKGDADAGAILIKQNLLGAGFIVLTQVRRGDGQAVWLRGNGVMRTFRSAGKPSAGTSKAASTNK